MRSQERFALLWTKFSNFRLVWFERGQHYRWTIYVTMSVYMNMHIYVYIYIYIYMYISYMYVYMSLYIYLYIYD